MGATALVWAVAIAGVVPAVSSAPRPAQIKSELSNTPSRPEFGAFVIFLHASTKQSVAKPRCGKANHFYSNTTFPQRQTLCSSPLNIRFPNSVAGNAS